MQRLIYVSLFVAMISGGQPRSPSTKRPERLLSSHYGFSFSTPRGWFGGQTIDGLPSLFNFEPNKTLGGGALPHGGAEIVTVVWDQLPRRRGDETLKGWAQADLAAADSRTARVVSLALPSETGIAEALQSSFTVNFHSVGERPQHHVIVYWAFRRKMFSLRLSYIEGDPRGRKYERQFVALMRSIRPI